MSIGTAFLYALLSAFIFVPIGYIVRVMVSRTTNSVGRSPCVDEIYDHIGTLQKHQAVLGTSVGQFQQDVQLLQSKLQLMSTEMADFFDKTRKSEERQRGLTRRAEAAIGDEENTADMDQQLLDLMQEQPGEQGVGGEAAPMTRDEYYRTQGP